MSDSGSFHQFQLNSSDDSSSSILRSSSTFELEPNSYEKLLFSIDPCLKIKTFVLINELWDPSYYVFFFVPNPRYQVIVITKRNNNNGENEEKTEAVEGELDFKTGGSYLLVIHKKYDQVSGTDLEVFYSKNVLF